MNGNIFLKPYWFLEPPIDLEYKYYILMSYLVKRKEHFNKVGFEKYFKEILILKRDLLYFITKGEISQRSFVNMTDSEKEEFYKLVDENSKNKKEINEIIKNSIKTIEEFLEENNEIYQKYNSLVDVKIYPSKYNLWDQGILIFRKPGKKYLKIFNWFFSIVKIGKKENLALLMTELLDPKCPSTKDIIEIRKFLKNNIKDYIENHDCILINDLSKGVDFGVGIEIGKEKSIEIIMSRFKNFENI